MSKTTLGPVEIEAVLHPSALREHAVAFIDQIKACPEGRADTLFPLLSERHPIYRNQSTNQVVRMRGYAMAALELTGLPNRALPYVLESLENSFHPYLVAAAARALRGIERPHPQFAPYLIKAIYNVWRGDNPVSFASYHVEWPREEFSTALTEIFETLAHFGGFSYSVLPDLEHLAQSFRDKLSANTHARLADAIDAIRNDDPQGSIDCCGLPTLLQGAGEPSDDGDLESLSHDLVIEDQDGSVLKWGEFFCEKPTVLAFFYTRCGNPRKCTQTIFNLATVRNETEKVGLAGKVRVAAITYDPQFDTSAALKSYGNARRFRFDADTKMFRVPDRFDQVVQAFNLGVNFTGSQVNSHRIELFLLDHKGELARSFLRLQSDPEQVVQAISALLPSGRKKKNRPEKSDAGRAPKESKVRSRFQSVSSLVLGVLVAFFPKCPMCWVSYMSVLGLTGAESIPYRPWMLPAIVVLLTVNLYFLFRGAPSRNGYAPFLLCLFGSALLLFSLPQIGMPRWLVAPGIGLLILGSLIQSLSFSKFNRLKLFVSEFRPFLKSLCAKT